MIHDTGHLSRTPSTLGSLFSRYLFDVFTFLSHTDDVTLVYVGVTECLLPTPSVHSRNNSFKGSLTDTTQVVGPSRSSPPSPVRTSVPGVPHRVLPTSVPSCSGPPLCPDLESHGIHCVLDLPCTSQNSLPLRVSIDKTFPRRHRPFADLARLL